MGFVDTNLIPGESVAYRARLHWVVMAPALIAGAVLDVIACALLVGAFLWQGPRGEVSMPLVITAAALAVIGSGWVAAGAIRRRATEIAVTTRRVLIKSGLVRRRTTEVLLAKVESVAIEESVVGRMLGFGTVTIHGTGGTPEAFDRIASPNEFRRQIQSQIDALPSTPGVARIA